MVKYVQIAMITAIIAACTVNVASSFAQPNDRNPNSPGLGWGPPQSRGAPGPLAGAGLPFLIGAGAVGAYKLIRRRQAEKRPPADTANQV